MEENLPEKLDAYHWHEALQDLYLYGNGGQINLVSSGDRKLRSAEGKSRSGPPTAI